MNKKANGGIKLASLSATAICILVSALFIMLNKVAWGIFFIILAVVLAIITGKS